MAAGTRHRFRRRIRRARGMLLDQRTRLALHNSLPSPYWQLRFHSFGPSSLLHRPIWIAGAHKMSVGEQCRIVSSWLGVERQAWEEPGLALVIGDRVNIRPYCTIRAAESVTIEDDVAVASFSQIIDSHPRLDGPHDQIELNPLVTDPVRIGRGTGIGERVAVLPGSNIGKFCVIGTNSVVQGRIPDYSIAVGAPARAVGRTREPPSLS